MGQTSTRRIIAAGAIGNILEWYDFAVYGYFAALTVAPIIRDAALAIGIASASSESAMAAGLVMGVMIIPFVSSMADDSLAAVPSSMRDGSLAMGATPSETIRKVMLPAALPGVVGGVLLAVSRAIGETMIVVMAASGAGGLVMSSALQRHFRDEMTKLQQRYACLWSMKNVNDWIEERRRAA